jgi:hypothetical protein
MFNGLAMISTSLFLLATILITKKDSAVKTESGKKPRKKRFRRMNSQEDIANFMRAEPNGDNAIIRTSQSS